jgi:hypothetical protein
MIEWRVVALNSSTIGRRRKKELREEITLITAMIKKRLA